MLGHATSMEEINASVSEVAHRTRMLGLNAAIEAERAGQFGQGFRVGVEIKDLADENSGSGKRVQEGLTALRPALVKAKSVMSDLSNEGVRVVEGAEEMRGVVADQTACQETVSIAATEGAKRDLLPVRQPIWAK